MSEHTVSRTISLSERHPSLKVSMTISVDFQPPDYSVEVSRQPGLFPIELYDPLWSNGIDSGVLQAVDETNFILDVASVYIKIQRLEISEAFDTFNEKEISQLGKELKIMTYETLYPIFSAKANSAS